MSTIDLSELGDPSAIAGNSAVREYRERWQRIPFETAPAERERAEAGIALAYKIAGLPRPEILWFASPAQLERARRSLWLSRSAGDCVRREVVDDPVSEALRVSQRLPPHAYATLIRTFDLSPRFATAVRRCVSADAEDVGWGVAGTFRLMAASWCKSQRYVAFDNASMAPSDLRGLLGLCQYVHDKIGWRDALERLAGLWEVALAAGWLVPHRNICFVSDRWSVCNVDAAGRPHCDTGPALAFRDGWKRYFWKSIEVSPWMIEVKHRITSQLIDQEPRPLVRRCMIDILTPAEYVKDGPRVVATDRTGRLWQRRWSMTDIWAAVEVTNGTRGPDGGYDRYYLQVPGHFMRPIDAVAWTYGMDATTYRQLSVRT